MKTLTKVGWATISLAMLLLSCQKEKRPAETPPPEKTFAVANFEKIEVADPFQLSIRQGNTFLVKANGPATNLNDMELTVNATGRLKIGYKPTNRPHPEVVKVEIVMPQLQVLYANGAAKATINGFRQQASFMRMELTENAEAVVAEAPDELSFLLYGKARLQATGSIAGLYGSLYNSSSLDAYGLGCFAAEINSYGTSEARFTAGYRLRLEAADASVIRYKGDPQNVRTETTGTAQIIKE